MFKITEESNIKVLSECLRLGQLHYDEVFEHKKDKVPRNYNWQFLKICMDNGLIHIVTARNDKGELVGYFANTVGPDMFSSTFVAKELAIFVHPEYRRSGLFSSMLLCMEELLKNNGVTSQILAFQEGHNDQIPLGFGYRPTERIYEKILLGD